MTIIEGTTVRPIGSEITYRVTRVNTTETARGPVSGVTVECLVSEVVRVPGRQPTALHRTERFPGLLCLGSDGVLRGGDWRAWEVVS